MHSRLKRAAGLSLGFLALTFSPLTAHAQGTLQVVLSGLNNPHGLTVGPDGTLYVADAGTGGSFATTLPNPNGPGTLNYGTTGDVRSYNPATHAQSIVISGLPSLAVPSGAEATGIQDLAFSNGALYGVIGYGENPATTTKPNINQDSLVRFGLNPGFPPSVTSIADLGAYEAANNPDGADLNSNPYSLAALSNGSFAVADAGANDVVGVSVTPGGTTLSTLGVLPAMPVPPGPPFYQAVPTAVKAGPDGALYVSELTGYPFPKGQADIFRIDPITGKPTVFAGGFTTISDFAFGPGGSLYVLDITTNGLATAPSSGELFQVNPLTGERTTLIDSGLSSPDSLAEGPNGTLYISELGTSSGGGKVLQFNPVPEASTTVSLGLLLMFGLGGLAFARKRKAV